MKGYHFTIIFSIIAIVVFTMIDMDTEELAASVHNKFFIEETFMSAVDAGTNGLLVSIEKEDILAKERANEEFFFTLAAGFGILDNPFQQELLKLYIPVLAITTEDGFYILFNDEYDNNGVLEVSKQWSELIPYSYEDDNFVYRFTLNDKVTLYDKNNILGEDTAVVHLDFHEIKDNPFYKKVVEVSPDNIMLEEELFYLTKNYAITSKLEEYLSYYVNCNNDIAEHFGVTYQFILPETDNSEWVRGINGTGMIVIFQGFPYNNGRSYYNQFAVAGATIKHADIYYIVAKDWYYEYHKEGCEEFIKGNEIKTCYDMESCAKEGAFACKECQVEAW